MMQELEIKNVDCHATLAMIEKRWGFPRRTLRALLGMTENTQSGRSMIEMLGVLAIIGVLSVGGIAGYSKAMQKYRINKAIEQITLIVGNIRTFFAPQKNYIGLTCQSWSSCNSTNGCYPNGCPIIKKAKLVPDEMLTVNDAGKITAITNPFGGWVGLYTDHKATGGDNQAFGISYFIGDNIEACIELLSQDWAEAKMIAVNIYNRGGELDYNFKSLPIPVDKATEKCAEVIESAPNDTQLGFYFDIDTNSEEWDIDWAD